MGESGSVIDGISMYRIDTAPRPAEPHRMSPHQMSPSFAALVAAHGALQDPDSEALLVSLWLREPGVDGFRFLIGGKPALPGVRQAFGGNAQAIPYPPGCQGEIVSPQQVANLADLFPAWLPCLGEPDILWSRDGDRDESHRSFSQYVTHLRDPFAWLVLASPVDVSGIDSELEVLENELARLRPRTTLETDRVAVARSEARFEEVNRGRAHGLWSLKILVGAATESAARQAALLLCSSSAGTGLPYVLIPAQDVGSLHHHVSTTISNRAAKSPFLASTEYLSAVVGPPSIEMPGIHLRDPNPFDVTPEPCDADAIPLGVVLDQAGEAAEPLAVTRSTLNRHTFVTGATGSGKSQTTRWMLEQLSSAEPPIPWLVLEPAKSEYARMAGRLQGVAPVTRIRPGSPEVPPPCLNPLEPAPGYPLQSHLDLIRALFLAAFEANEPFPQVLSQALTQCYSDAGWDLVTGEPRPRHKPRLRLDEPVEDSHPSYPQLSDLQQCARNVVEAIGYGREVAANVRGFVDVRIGSLCTGTPGRFFQGGHPIEIDALLEKNVVIELEGITDDQDKAFLIGAFIIRIVEHLRVRYGETGCDDLKHVLVVEEAHRLLKNVEDGPAAAAVELFASMLAEIRAYGEGLLVVEQIPAKVTIDVIKNTALKIVHRLPAEDDRAAVGGTMNLNEDQSRYVVSMPAGLAAISADGMDRPLLVKICSGSSRESSEEVDDRAPLLGCRSTLCDPTCAEIPCTLRDINDAAHLAKQPQIVLWIEGIVISLLCGLVPSLADSVTYHNLRSLPVRQCRCVLAHAVDVAVSARALHLRPHFDVGDFKRVIFAQVVHQLDHEEPAPVLLYEKWQIGPYRYRDALTVIGNRQSQGRPLEQDILGSWRARGLDVTGEHSLEEVSANIRAVHRRQDPRGILGDTSQSGLTEAIALVGGDQSKEGVRYAFSRSCPGAPVREVCLRLGLEMIDDG